MVSDLPDFYKSTSPGFGMTRFGQVLNRIVWAGDIAAGATQTNITAVTLPGYLFTIDAIHLFTKYSSLVQALNPRPFRYEIALNFVAPPGVPVWTTYYSGWVEASKTIRMFHVTGAGIAGVYGIREIIYNDSDMLRYYESYIYYLYNEGI
jgi:hypothetical protein